VHRQLHHTSSALRRRLTSFDREEEKAHAMTDKEEDTSISKRRCPVCLVVGMGGSGKTTLMQRLNAELHRRNIEKYIVNLDPAVAKGNVPYGVNIDIRDTVDYAKLMKQYSLGPNGAIMTALNLFCTRFDKVLHLMEKRAEKAKYMFVDTPGQIEVFTWSASGDIVAKLLASSFPTVMLFVIDTPRTTKPATFMSNMLYACSMFYKFKLPIVLVFNKCDIVSHDFAKEWMEDFETFQEALNDDKSDSYMTSLLRSMSLVLDDFYASFRNVGVSAATGLGINDLLKAIDEAAEEYEKDYRPSLDRAIAERKKVAEDAQKKDLDRLRRDVELNATTTSTTASSE